MGSAVDSGVENSENKCEALMGLEEGGAMEGLVTAISHFLQPQRTARSFPYYCRELCPKIAFKIS